MDFTKIYKKIGVDKLMFVTLCSVLLLQCFIWFNMILFLICIVILTFIRKYKIACFILIAIVYSISFRLELLDFLEKREKREKEKKEAEEQKRNNNKKVNIDGVNESVNVKEESIKKEDQSPANDDSINNVQCKVDNETPKESGGVQIIDSLPITLDKRPIADQIGNAIQNQWENIMKNNDNVEEAGKGELPNDKNKDDILSDDSSNEEEFETVVLEDFDPKVTYTICCDVKATNVSEITDCNGNQIGYVSKVAVA